MAGLGGMASGIAGEMAVRGVGQLIAGRRPELRDLLLTPRNAARLTDQLARMRGAAMKVGQLISMDAGEMMPSELGQILSRLRADADYMPPRQLKQVLSQAWGAGWLDRFERFDVRPIAAASIGQVHRAQTRDGRDLAIKVQYPGVARSIDSDVQNVGSLIRLSGLLPAGLDLAPLLEEAKAQLHDEADYLREREELLRFADLTRGMHGFVLPSPQDDLTTATVLAMSYQPGDPVESLEDAPERERNDVAARLVDLTFREIFDFGHIQSDPNFANYRHDARTGQIVLLDFGAARAVPPALAASYRALFRAGLAGADMTDAALSLGLFGGETRAEHRKTVCDMLELVFAPLRAGGMFDFADASLARHLQQSGMEMAEARDFVHIPPVDTLFVQRKFGGLYLLCARLRARVDVRALLEQYL